MKQFMIKAFTPTYRIAYGNTAEQAALSVRQIICEEAGCEDKELYIASVTEAA